MIRRNMMRWACAVAGIAMVVSGCECPGPNPPVNCSDTTITFETPTADQTVDSPFDVSIVVKNADGTAFSFDGAELSVAGGTAIAATSVSGNRATFTGVSAGAGAQGLVSTIRKGTCTKTSPSHPIIVRDACSNAAVSVVSFPQDTGAPLGTLSRSELPPGMNLQVKVDATCVSGVQVRIKRGTTEVSPLTPFTNGTAIITVPSLPDSDNARYDLFAELVRGATVINTPSGNPQAAGSIEVKRALPSCAVTTMGSFGLRDDADGSTPGFQMRVTGTMDITSSGTLAVNGQTPVGVVPNMVGDVSADFTIATSGIFMATLSCTDGSGNTNTATGSFRVNFDPPTVTIVSPANVDGGATMTVTQSPLQVQVATNAPNGSTAVIRRNGMTVGSGTVLNGMVTLPVSFGVDGVYTLTVEVTDTSGNTGSAGLTVTVALDGCGAIFTRPMACPALLTPTQLSNGAYSFQTTSKAACSAQPVALFRADVLADGGMGAEVAAGTSTVTASGTADFAPLTLTSGDYLFRGQVTNLGPDAGVSVTTCAVTVDLDGPVITNPIVPTGSPAATINASQDTQPGTPGAQRVLTFSARVPLGGRVDVCTTQAINPVTMTARPTSPECGSGWYLLQQGVSSPSNAFTFPDGAYDLKIVVVGGGLPVAPASPSVAVLVDTVRPCLSAITRSLPQDANMDGRLNIAELAGGPPRLQFDLGCGDTGAATLATLNPVVVRDIVAGALGPVRASTASAVGARYTVTLTGPYTTETDLDLFVELTDLAGNRNQLAATNDPSSFDLRIDPIAPSCSIVSPAAALLGIAQVPGANLDVLVSTGADVGPNGVVVSFTGVVARTLSPALSQAQTTYALTGDNTYTIGATCTDQSGNATAAPARTTRVDLVAPTCNITAPTNLAVSSVNDVSTTVAVTGVSDNELVLVSSSVAGITNNQLTVAGGSATRVVRYPNGTQTITAAINDAAGNACVAASGGTLQIQLTVNSTSCSLDFAPAGAVSTNANGSWVNRAGAGNPAGANATVTIAAVTSDCGAGRNVYLYAGPPLAVPTGTPQVTNAGGAVTFAGVNLTDGQQWTVTIDNGAGVLTHRSFTASFLAPTITSIGLQRSATVTTVVAVGPNAPLTFGAAAGNRRVETAVATDLVFGDLDAVAADAQFQLSLTGIEGARVGTLNASLDVLEGTTALMPTLPITSAAFTPTLPRMRLGHRLDETTTTLVIRVTSPAGNIFVSTHAAEVDVIAPAAPAATPTLSSVRAATVGLTWMPVFDDAASAGSGGLTGGVPAAGYDVRWTTSSVIGNNSMLAEADYFGASSNPEAVTPWSASAINTSLTLPPINTYFIAVRARDEVGNYSPFVAPPAVPNPWIETTLTGAAASSNFGQTTAVSSSVNSDTVDDLVVTAPAEAGGGAVYVYFGGSSFASQNGCPAVTCQRLGPSDATGGSFGADLSTGGNVGDVAGELKSDVLVAQTQSAAPNNLGRVVLFFGSAGASLTPADAIEFRGDATFRIGFSARIIRDLDGDGLDEIAISAPVATVGGVANRGRVFIFRGRTRAQWAALRTATDPVTTVPYVPVNGGGANHVINGPNPLLATAGNGFGLNRYGLASVGDLNSDGVPDLGIPTSRPVINRYRVISGLAIRNSTPALPLDADTAMFEITESPTAETTITNGLGAAVLTGKDVIDSSANDLVASSPSGGRIQIYSNPMAAASNPAPTLTIQGPITFGYSISGGPLNGADTSNDLVIPLGNLVNNEAWVLYRRGTGFDTGIGVSPAFWVSRFQGSVITGSSTTALGRGNALGELDGQNGNDLVLGDERANLVKVWR